MLESVAGFVEAGWRVVVALPVTGPLVGELERLGADVVRTRTAVLRRSALRPAGLLRFVADVVTGAAHGVRLLRRVRPDAVYVSTVTLPLWMALARVVRRPLVCHVHEAEVSLPVWLRRLLMLPVLLSSTVVVNSEFTGTVLGSSLPRATRRAVVVHNAVPGPADTTPARVALRDPLRLAYVGRLSPRKGVDVAVEAVGRLRDGGLDLRLDVVGDVFPGYEWFEAQLRERIAELDLADEVRLRGFHPVVWPFLADADVVVVPSVGEESFGNAAVEAVLAARPVVVSATSGLSEAVAPYSSAREVPPGDPAALAEAVRAVVGDWPAARGAALVDA
ncbi:glycosyltransferase, partial [Actinotalea ferrariae]|nr:glycosyltransferase [Actinotalea ferrariae]